VTLTQGKYYRAIENPDGYGMGQRVIVGKYLETREIDGQEFVILCRGMDYDRSLCKVSKWTFEPLSSLEAELY
jgi:hypothetical protein